MNKLILALFKPASLSTPNPTLANDEHGSVIQLPSGDKIDEDSLIITPELLARCQDDFKQIFVCVQIRKRTTDGNTLTALTKSEVKTKETTFINTSVLITDNIFVSDVVLRLYNKINFVATIKAASSRMISNQLRFINESNKAYNIDPTLSVAKSINEFDDSTIIYVGHNQKATGTLGILNTIYVDENTNLICTSDDTDFMGFYDNQYLLSKESYLDCSSNYATLDRWSKVTVEHNTQQDDAIAISKRFPRDQTPSILHIDG